MSCCGCLPFRSPMSRRSTATRLQQRQQASRAASPLPATAQPRHSHRQQYGASTTQQLSLMELQQLSSLPASPRTASSPRPPLPASPPALLSTVPMTRLSVPMKLMPPALPSSPPRLHHIHDLLRAESDDGGREGQHWQPHCPPQPQPHQPIAPPTAALPAPIIIQVRTPVPEEGDAAAQQQQEEQWEEEEDEDEYGSEDDSPYLELYEGEEVTMDLQPLRAPLPVPPLLDPRLAAMGKAAAAMYAFYNSDQQQPQTAARQPDTSAEPTSASSPSPQQRPHSALRSHSRSRPRSRATASSASARRARSSAAAAAGLPPPVPPRPRQSLSVQ